MYTVVETIGQQLMRAPDQIEYRLPCVVEDVHGIRLLITLDLTLMSVWERASAAGVQGIVRVNKSGFAFTTVEHYEQHRELNQFAMSYELPDRHWLPVSEWGQTYPVLSQLWTERFAAGDDPLAQLHTHTEFSAFDGYQTMDELGQRMTELGQHHVGISDHGHVAGHPAAHKMGKEYGLHVVYGMEAYFVDDRFSREGDVHDYWHLMLWAQDDQGLSNLWGASTEAYRDGAWGNAARLDWDTLARFNSGLLVSTACLGGPLADPYLKGDEQRALTNLARLGDLFGDRLSIELHTNRQANQIKVNEWLVNVGTRMSVPLIVAVDAHYARKEQQPDHKRWIAMQIGKDVSTETDLFSGDEYYHLHSVHEARAALDYLPDDVVEKAIAHTGALAESCTAEIRPKIVTPVFSRPTTEHPDPVKHDVERFMDAIEKGFAERITSKGLDPKPHLDKLGYEVPLLVQKGFPGYFLMCSDFVQWAKYDGGPRGPILVGPGRGSGGASEAAWLMKITELDPVEGKLLIDRFLTEGRTELPDFDIDFPSSRGEDVITYVQERWGREHVARVGSHMRIKNKGAFRGVQKAIASELPGESFAWVEAISKLIKQAEASTAGLGLSWDELMDQIGDLLEPFKEKMPVLFELAEKFHNRLQTYGKHAAGFIIDPDENLEQTLPMRRGEVKEGDDEANAPMVTQWDMDALTYIGKVKFDLLRLRNLDTIDLTVTTIKQETGRRIDPYEWHDEYEDPEVFDALSEGRTLGVFQIETPLGTRVTRQLKPKNRADLTNIITIGRPGPLRSGLDKVYMRRRDGLEQVTYPDPRLEAVLSDTFGVMLYQEDIMNICKVLAGYSSDEADKVRKILGKKQVEKAAAEGVKFVERAVANNTDRQVAIDLWAQMQEFAKYSFNKAHAYAYATIGCWTAWLKVHYARQSLTSSMATIKKERIPQFVSEARRLGYQVLPPDINISKRGFAAKGLQIRYGFESLPGIGSSVAPALVAYQPYTSFEDFVARACVTGSPVNRGHAKTLARIGAFDTLHPNRRALEARLVNEMSGDADRCQLYDSEFRNVHNELPCRFDWDSEPKRYGRPNKAGERKLLSVQPKIPTQCRRKACRQYVPKPPEDFEHLPNFTDAEVREREVEMLGVYLSSSPFDIVPDEMLGDFYSADDLLVSQNGMYPIAAVVLNVRNDPKGRDFGFATLLTPSGEISVIMWSKDFARLKPIMPKGTLGFGRVIKTGDDRYRLDVFEPLQ